MQLQIGVQHVDLLMQEISFVGESRQVERKLEVFDFLRVSGENGMFRCYFVIV